MGVRAARAARRARHPTEVGDLRLKVVEPGVAVGCPAADQRLWVLPCRGDHLEFRPIRKENHRALGADHPAPALDDQVEQFLEADAFGDRARDVRGRFQPAERPLQLLRALVEALVEARVLDRHSGPGCKDDGDLLVGLVELRSTLLFGQVEVAPGLAAHQHRCPEEGLHLRVRRGESVRARVRLDVREAQGAGISDQLAKDPPSPRERADLAPGLLVNPGVQEALQAGFVLVQDTQGGIPGAGQIARSIEHPAKHGLRVELGDDCSTDFEELFETLIRERVLGQGSVHLVSRQRLPTRVPRWLAVGGRLSIERSLGVARRWETMDRFYSLMTAPNTRRRQSSTPAVC